MKTETVINCRILRRTHDHDAAAEIGVLTGTVAWGYHMRQVTAITGALTFTCVGTLPPTSKLHVDEDDNCNVLCLYVND